MKKSVLAACLLVLTVSGIAADKPVYRWKDADGRVHYGQIPPQGVRYEEVRPRGPRPASPATRDTADTGLSGEVDQFLEQAAREREAEQEAEAKARAEREVAARNCQIARDRAQNLEERGARRLAVKKDDGSLARMTQEEFEERTAETQRAIEENCR